MTAQSGMMEASSSGVSESLVIIKKREKMSPRRPEGNKDNLSPRDIPIFEFCSADVRSDWNFKFRTAQREKVRC